MKKLLLIMLSFVCINVYAETCTSAQKSNLFKVASNVKVNYEVAYEDVSYVDEISGNVSGTLEYLNIIFYNITDEIFLIVTNDFDNESVAINYNNSNKGKYVMRNDNMNNIVKYTIKVYSTGKDCSTYLIKTITYTKPMRNPNSYYEICQNNPEVPVCKEFITSKGVIKNDGLVEYVENYLRINGTKYIVTTTSSSQSGGNFFKDNMWYLIGGAVALSLGITSYIIISKRRSRI